MRAVGPSGLFNHVRRESSLDKRHGAWKGKSVVILGLARQGSALARYLAERQADVTVSDMRTCEDLQLECQALEGKPIKFALGGHPESILDDADLLCVSGGVPLDIPIVQTALEKGIPLSNDAALFLERCPAPVIGVTGSAGKTTTTTLLGRMAMEEARSRGVNAFVGGNIGRPLIMDLDAIGPDDLVVMELSSFQLELMAVSPQVAAILNLTPNHLDRHGTMAAYSAAKARILAFQTADDVAVLGRDDPGAWSLREQVEGSLLAFGCDLEPELDGTSLQHGDVLLCKGGFEQVICRREDIPLRGEHNVMNVLAACALADAAGFSLETMREGIDGFEGVAHRMESVAEIDGVCWYNDSIATTPERAIASMRSFDEPLVLLAGGRDKKLPWEAFSQEVARRVHHLIVFGEAAEKIARAVEPALEKGNLKAVLHAKDLEEAVELARRHAQAGDVVLLAPGGTSYDAYRDFEARGEHFRRLVRAL